MSFKCDGVLTLGMNVEVIRHFAVSTRQISTMKTLAILAFALLMFESKLLARAQEALSVTHSPPSSDVTFHSSADLVLVDVIALKNGLPDKTLKRGDFEVFDNGHPVSIAMFDSGTQFATRPLALWFVVQCYMPDIEEEGTRFFRGQISLFKPALKFSERQDTVAVAHWCDNGDAKLDLLPTSNVDQVPTILEQVLAPSIHADDHERTGELALQKALQLVIDATRSSKPLPVPVVIFLFGDHSGMPKSEANHFIDELLETSAIALGVRDSRSSRVGFLIGEQKEVAHYIAAQTGGQYFDATPETFATALEEILQQLHFRYELAFKPEDLDGKRHKLTVKLADAVKDQHKGVRLRYRAGYVPIRVPHRP